MDLEKVERLLEIVAKSGMAEVEVEEEGFRLLVRAVAAPGSVPTVVAMHQPMAMPMAGPMPGYGGYASPPALAPPPALAAPADAAPAATPAGTPAAAPPPSDNDTVVQAPIVGTFYSSPSPDSDPYVAVGSMVKPGDVLCIIEAMKLMNEIQAEVGGTVKEILAENAQAVEYDQPLFVIEEG